MVARLPRAKMLSRVQHLIGKSIGAYEDDRSECRASKVLDPLREAFDLVVQLRDKYKPDRIRARAAQGDDATRARGG